MFIPGTLLLFGAAASAAPTTAAPANRIAGATRPGLVPYGRIIESCTVPGTVALTYDDGPNRFTAHILDVLAAHGAHATFFVNGDNWGRGLIDDPATPWPATLRRMLAEGHQVGSHTWSHADLSGGDADSRYREVNRLAVALDKVLGGKHPRYLRPPYGSCGGPCLSELGDLGYHAVNWNVDTKDYLHNTPETIHESEEVFAAAVAAGGQDGYIVLSHDVHETTGEVLTEFMLQTLAERGFKAVTVGECLGDPKENWYMSGDGSS